MTRNKLGRMKVAPPDERTAEKYLLWLSGRNLHEGPEELPRFASQSLFGDGRPLELEAGCGTGEFLCALAAERSDTNFVGVDLHAKSLFKAVEIAVGLRLENVRFVRADFRQVYPLFVPGALRAVYLHFPEPGDNRISRKRRIFSETFLNEVFRALAPGGRLSVVSDQEEYLLEMLGMAERQGRWERAHAERYLAGSGAGVRSRFQRMWEERGRTTARFELVKPELAPTEAPGYHAIMPTGGDEES